MTDSDRRDDPVVAAAAAIADGREVAWSDLERSSGRPVADRLRSLDALGRAFRSTAPAVSVAATAEATDAPLFTWGRLEVLEQIGAGSFGEVFRAWDPVLDRHVALKLRRAGPSEAEGGGRRYLAEARRLARVRHPNVLAVHAADIHDGRVGLETDLVDGVTLDRELAERGPWGAAEAVAVGGELCRALAAVHAAGLVHGDVKGANVMRERGGRIVLMDFGAGMELGPEGQATGRPSQWTPVTVAPEVLRGAPAGPAADVYALGCLLYRMLSGRHPITASSVDELLQAHREGRRTPLRDLRPDLPAELVEAVETALSPEPGERFASAGAMERALRRIAGGSEARDETGTTPARRHRLVVGSVAASVLALAAVVGVLALQASGGRDADGTGTPPGGGPVSIAVLPFEDLSGDDSDGALAAGLAENLRVDLARLDALRVIGRHSSTEAAEAGAGPREIAAALTVGHLCSGSVQRSGDTVRVTVELVEPASGELLWAERYDRPVDDVLAIQSDLVQSIVRALHLELTPAEDAHLAARAAADPEAARLSLEARSLWWRRNRADVARAEELYREALAIDPGHAPAWAGLADVSIIQASHGWEPQDEAAALARSAAERALELDPDDAQALTSLASLHQSFAIDWPEAERLYRRAIAAAPSYVVARTWYGELLMYWGRFAEGRAQSETAHRLDPLAPVPDLDIGKSYYFEHRWDDAVAWLDGTVARHPDNPYAVFYRALAKAGGGRLDAAIADLEAMRERWPRFFEAPTVLANLYGRADRRAEAEAHLQALLEARRTQPVPAFAVAIAYLGLGEHEPALTWLERSVDDGDWQITFLGVEPLLDPLRGTPRFERLVERAGVRPPVPQDGPGPDPKG